MMETKNIMIVGVGGQGSLLASKLLGHLLLTEGYDVIPTFFISAFVYDDHKYIAQEESLEIYFHIGFCSAANCLYFFRRRTCYVSQCQTFP